MALFLTGCSKTLPPLPPPTTQSEISEVSIPRQQLSDSAYTLGPEDVVRVTVYDHPDLSQEVTIAPDGSFPYPLLGKFQASGLTVQELEQQLTRRLADGYLVKPQLTAAITHYRNRHVYVLGAVRNPGVYPLPYSATLLELISQAGGVMPEAGWQVLLVRASGGASGNDGKAPTEQAQAAALHIDLEKLLAGQLPHPISMASGDTIYVPPGGYFFVSGQVVHPGRYRLERGMTVEKAVVLAGGFTRFAGQNRLRVKRIIAGQREEFQAQPDDHLAAEDVLFVPESIF
jgi:polysaccharide export outer membrane protein